MPPSQGCDRTHVMETAQTLQFEQRHRLALALEHAGIDGPDMADELGVHRNTITNYLKGHTQPSKAVLKVWARVTNVPFEWLRTGSFTETGTDGEFLHWPEQLRLFACAA